MKRDANRRFLLLTLGAWLEGRSGVRLGFAAEALRECLNLELLNPGPDNAVGGTGCVINAVLLFEACVCGLAKDTLREARF